MKVDTPAGVWRKCCTATELFNVGSALPQSIPFRTMVLEDDRTSLALVTQAVLRAVPETLIFTARSLAEGRQLLGEYQFEFCVLDIQLPDGIGIDFLYDIQSKCSKAAVVIFTAQALPEYRDQAQAFGVLHFMEKTTHLRVLGGFVRDHWERLCGEQANETGTGFSASLSRLSTLDIIQIKCLGRSTVSLDFIGRQGRHGRIYFERGEIIHAETDTQQGEEAFNEIISWRDGQVTELADSKKPEQTIRGPWQTLLMHAVHWADEHRQP